MKPRPVVIVGQMRSGTSMVAELVHRLGWHAAVTMGAPAPPSWRTDWEDLELTMTLLQGVNPGVPWLIDYLGRRVEVSERMGFGGRIALKSPYLLFIWDDLFEALDQAGFPHPVVIRTYRYDLNVLRSLRAHPQLSEVRQAQIARLASRIAPTVEIGYEAAIERPLWVAVALAQALGVVDDAAIRAAAALVGRPTPYECLPSQPSSTGRAEMQPVP